MAKAGEPAPFYQNQKGEIKRELIFSTEVLKIGWYVILSRSKRLRIEEEPAKFGKTTE